MNWTRGPLEESVAANLTIKHSHFARGQTWISFDHCFEVWKFGEGGLWGLCVLWGFMKDVRFVKFGPKCMGLSPIVQTEVTTCMYIYYANTFFYPYVSSGCTIARWVPPMPSQLLLKPQKLECLVAWTTSWTPILSKKRFRVPVGKVLKFWEIKKPIFIHFQSIKIWHGTIQARFQRLRMERSQRHGGMGNGGIFCLL